MNLCIIFPTRGRVQQALTCLHALYRTAPDASIVVLSEDAGAEVFSDVPSVALVRPQRDDMTAIEKWNLGLWHTSGADAYVLGADDVEPFDGWYEAVVGALRTGAGMVGIADGHQPGALYAAHYAFSREFLVKHHGGVMAVPHYRSWYCDLEARKRADRAGAYVAPVGATWYHNHVVFGNAPDDETYQRGKRWREIDQRIYRERMNAGFPDDFDPILYGLQTIHNHVATPVLCGSA